MSAVAATLAAWLNQERQGKLLRQEGARSAGTNPGASSTAWSCVTQSSKTRRRNLLVASWCMNSVSIPRPATLSGGCRSGLASVQSAGTAGG